MQSATVTIGRNDGETPMDSNLWDAFKGDVRESLEAIGNIVSDAEYVGEWEGVSEDAHVFVVLANRDTFDTPAIDRLKGHLASAADTYRQDAIGLAIGNSELITSDRAKAFS